LCTGDWAKLAYKYYRPTPAGDNQDITDQLAAEKNLAEAL